MIHRVSGQQRTLDSPRKSRREQTHDAESLPQNCIVSWGHPTYTALQTEAHDGSADISKAFFRHMEVQREWWGVERLSGWRDLAWVEGVEMHPREDHSNLWCTVNSSFHFWTQHYYRCLLQAVETPSVRRQKCRVQTAVLVEWPYSGKSLDCVGLEFMMMGSRLYLWSHRSRAHRLLQFHLTPATGPCDSPEPRQQDLWFTWRKVESRKPWFFLHSPYPHSIFFS